MGRFLNRGSRPGHAGPLAGLPASEPAAAPGALRTRSSVLLPGLCEQAVSLYTQAFRMQTSEPWPCTLPAPAGADLQLAPRLLLLRVLQLYCPRITLLTPFTRFSPVCQPTSRTAVLLQVLNREIKNALFIFVCLLCIICVNSVINTSQHSTIWTTVLVGYLSIVCWT